MATYNISKINLPSGDVCNINAAVPIATTAATGVVKVGSNLSITTAGVLSVPTASTSTVGAIKIGTAATNAAAGNHTHSTYAPSAVITLRTTAPTEETVIDGAKIAVVTGNSTIKGIYFQI